MVWTTEATSSEAERKNAKGLIAKKVKNRNRGISMMITRSADKSAGRVMTSQICLVDIDLMR